MDLSPMLNYVNTVSGLLGIPMDAERADRVTSHLQRTAAMATMLQAAELAPDDELAEIYNPAAFRPNISGHKQLWKT